MIGYVVEFSIKACVLRRRSYRKKITFYEKLIINKYSVRFKLFETRCMRICHPIGIESGILFITNAGTNFRRTFAEYLWKLRNQSIGVNSHPIC